MLFIDWLKSLQNRRTGKNLSRKANRRLNPAWIHSLNTPSTDLSQALRLELLEDHTLPSASDPVLILFPVLDYDADESGVTDVF